MKLKARAEQHLCSKHTAGRAKLKYGLFLIVNFIMKGTSTELSNSGHFVLKF